MLLLLGSQPSASSKSSPAPAASALQGGDEGVGCRPDGETGPELFDGFRRDDVVRLLQQALRDLGLEASRGALEEESGVSLEAPGAAELQRRVFGAQWDEVGETLHRLGLEPRLQRSLRFLLLEQRFLDRRAQDPETATDRWQEELRAAAFDDETRERLRRALESPPREESFDGQEREPSALREALWDRVAPLLPPELLVPPRRLSVLLWQAVRYQQLHCLYHDDGGRSPSGRAMPLLVDYSCEPTPLPAHCVACLDRHSDEVWFAAASHDGRYLASSSQDRTVILWECRPPGYSVVHVLFGHSEPCSCVAWSDDDRHLLTASSDRSVRLWAPPSHQAVRVFARHAGPVTSVCWLRDGKRFVSGGFDRRVCLWSIDGTELHRWELANRVQDLCVPPSGQHVLVVDSDRGLKVLDVASRRELPPLPEGDAVTSVCASALREQVLVNIAQQVCGTQQGPMIRLWDLAARRVVQRYLGHAQSRFVVRSCFGGPREEFVFSGSEDHHVYVWHRHYGSLLQVLEGHSGTVNCVTWTRGRSKAGALISASDDQTLRVWSPNPLDDGDDVVGQLAQRPPWAKAPARRWAADVAGRRGSPRSAEAPAVLAGAASPLPGAPPPGAAPAWADALLTGGRPRPASAPPLAAPPLPPAPPPLPPTHPPLSPLAARRRQASGGGAPLEVEAGAGASVEDAPGQEETGEFDESSSASDGGSSHD